MIRRAPDDDVHDAKRRKIESNRSKCTFNLHPRRKYQGNFPHFRRPCEIGSFSLDLARNFHLNKSQLKFYHKPDDRNNVNFDLTKGYSDMKWKDESIDEKLDDILRWIMRNRQCFLTDEERKSKEKSKGNLHTDFICWRGLLTKLLCTPYESRDSWILAVTLYNGSYYICDIETEKRKQQKETMTDKGRQMTYWGWKFEQYVTRLYSGEVDAVDPTSKADNKYVEFKTSREIDTPRQDENFKKFKLIKWWAQSYLVGIPLIVCGFRDDDGIVRRLENFQTAHIPDHVKNDRNAEPWSPVICFNFLNQFLTFVKEMVTIDNPKIVTLFEWEPSGDISCRTMEEGSKYCFLPDWYLNS